MSRNRYRACPGRVTADLAGAKDCFSTDFHRAQLDRTLGLPSLEFFGLCNKRTENSRGANFALRPACTPPSYRAEWDIPGSNL